MNFNNNQIKIIENLIDDRVFYLRENIGYCRNYLPECRTNHELEENHKAIEDGIEGPCRDLFASFDGDCCSGI